MMRNYQDIKGITINGNEYKLSQYGDDTNFLLNCSEKSLSEALLVLKLCYTMSGLKINTEKTRALWVGAFRSSVKICKDFSLDWSQKSLTILGVTFSPLVFNIWDLNSQCILSKVTNVLNHGIKEN